MAQPNDVPKIQVEQALQSIRLRLGKADNSFMDCVVYAGYEGYDERMEEQIAIDNLREAWLLILTLFENCGQQTLLDQAKQNFQAFQKNPFESAMGYDEPYLVWGARAYDLLSVFEDLYIPKRTNKKMVKSPIDLLTVIQNLEPYITSRKIFGRLPSGEDDIHDRIEGVLKSVYPDLVHKPTLSKPIKGFEPDTGIPSLSTIVEYKYIDSEFYGRSVVDQILADIGGYQDECYQIFVFVIYETERFFPVHDWRAAIAESNPPNTVEVVLLKGLVPTSIDFTESQAKVRKLKEKSKSRKKPS